MTITLTLNSDVEAELLAKAQAKGMAIENYLQAVVEQDAITPSIRMSDQDPMLRQDAVRRMIEFGEKYHLDLVEPITRELLHEGHRY